MSHLDSGGDLYVGRNNAHSSQKGYYSFMHAKSCFFHCFARNGGHVTSSKIISPITEYSRNRSRKHRNQRKQANTQKILNTHQSFALTLFILLLTITSTVGFAHDNTSNNQFCMDKGVDILANTKRFTVLPCITDHLIARVTNNYPVTNILIDKKAPGIPILTVPSPTGVVLISSALCVVRDRDMHISIEDKIL